MTKTITRAAALALTLGSALAIVSPASANPTGVWMNDTGRGAIEIKPCGGGLCGHVVWVKDTSDAGGCGRQLIGNATQVDSRTWDNGWIYSPDRKKNYDVELTELDQNRLRVKGYAGSKFFSKTMIWTRAPSDLVRCGTNTAAAAPAAVEKPAKVAEAKPEAATKVAPKVAEAPAKAAPPVANAAPAPAPAPAEAQVADASPAPAEDDGGFDKSDLSDRFGDVLTRSADGKCKLDLPWVKLNFNCDKR